MSLDDLPTATPVEIDTERAELDGKYGQLSALLDSINNTS